MNKYYRVDSTNTNYINVQSGQGANGGVGFVRV